MRTLKPSSTTSSPSTVSPRSSAWASLFWVRGLQLSPPWCCSRSLSPSLAASLKRSFLSASTLGLGVRAPLNRHTPPLPHSNAAAPPFKLSNCLLLLPRCLGHRARVSGTRRRAPSRPHPPQAPPSSPLAPRPGLPYFGFVVSNASPPW